MAALKWLAFFIILLSGIGYGTWIYMNPPRWMLEIGLPPYAKALPSTEPAIEFAHRVSELFPVPREEENLMTRLKKDGFQINTDTKTATIHRSTSTCNYFWTVSWLVLPKLGVTKIDGHYRSVCP